MKNKIRVNIMGRNFNLLSEKETEYLVKTAGEVERRMQKLRDENPDMDYGSTAVLVALNLCDELLLIKKDNDKIIKKEIEKAENEANHIRSQVMEYSKELSEATMTIKKLEKELEELKSRR